MHVESEPEVGVPVHVDRVVPERAHRHYKAAGGDEREREGLKPDFTIGD